MRTASHISVRRLLRPGFLTFTSGISAMRLAGHCLLLLAILFMSQTASRADVSLSLQIWHGYDFYYPSVGLNASSPDPVTYDRVESPNGIIWRNFGTNNDSNPFYLTNDLNAILDECNGSWKLYVNKGSGSEQLYYFNVSITGVTTNLFGNAVVLSPADGSSGVTNLPMFYWSGPTNLPLVNVNAYHKDSGNSYFDSLPGTATNWAPSGVLTPGDNDFFVEYYSNNFTGFAFATPTNSSGTLSGWSAEGDVFTYMYSFFSVRANSNGGGGGGHTNLLYYSFEDGDIFAMDYSTNGNNVQTISSFGDGNAYTTNTQTIGDYAAFFSNNGGGGASWLTPPTNLLATLAGSFSISLWVDTMQATGNDTDDGLYGNAGLVSAFNGSGNSWVVPMAITGSKLAFATGGSSQSTLHSATDINTGSYVHLVVTRNQATGEKKIYVNGVLDASETGSTDSLNTPTELSIGYNNGTGFDGRMDEIQIYSGVLSASEVLQLYNNPGTAIPDSTGNSSSGLIAHYDFDEDTAVAVDVSGNGNDVVVAGNFFGEDPQIDSDSIAGSGSISFDGGSFLTASSSLLPTLAGTFSLSLWVKTMDDSSYQGDVAWDGACVVSADVPDSLVNGDIIPVALTGGQVAFNTGSPDYGDNTINSSALVNDGQWHHIVVMRNQPTGEKDIYIDGVLDTSDFDTTNLLNDPKILTIGSKADASDSDPASPGETGSNGYMGLVDDIQIYNRVLSAEEVAFLHDNPGAVIAGSDFNAALNTANVTWTTGGDLPWFTQTTTTLDGLAAQSGPITNDQSSYLETTVTANGNVSFNWKVVSEDGYNFLTFYINGEEQDEITGEVDWNQETYSVSAGDVLRWEYSKDGSESLGQDAGWLDQIVLPGSADTGPVSANIHMQIYREQDPTFGDIFVAFPYINSTVPAPTGSMTNTVESPNGKFYGEIHAGGGYPSSYILSSFNDLMNEFTNGPWTLYINKGMPNERQFHFNATVNGLTMNLLSAVKIITPTNGAAGIPTNTAFIWLGPTNYSSLNGSKQFYSDNSGYVGGTLAVTATSWPSPPALAIGTNRFDITYASNGFPGIIFSLPVDNASLSVSNWVTSFDLLTTATSVFAVKPGVTPAQLINVGQAGGNFQFSFVSLSTYAHAVQYRTNLTAGSNWQTYTNITGDGMLKNISVPFSLFSPAKQGFIRVSTQ